MSMKKIFAALIMCITASVASAQVFLDYATIEDIEFEEENKHSEEDYSFSTDSEKDKENKYDFEEENDHENQRNKPGNPQ